jgi:hypothetical protein
VTFDESINDGLTLNDAHAGIPFPIAKTGSEAMWNHLTRYQGLAHSTRADTWIVDRNGRPILTGRVKKFFQFPYYDTSVSSSDIYYMVTFDYNGPARHAGERVLLIDPLNAAEKSRKVWQYLPGQRRTKLAPEIAFDTPLNGTGGVTNWDDAELFNGSMERFNWKLIGKKEIYIPYNCYKNYFSTMADFTPNFFNPDVVRWELHRVWIVEATLKQGKRHNYHRRTFYLDEDTWAAAASDNYDAHGNIYRIGFDMPIYNYDERAVFTMPTLFFDMMTNTYAMVYWMGEGSVTYTTPLPMRRWSADMISAGGVR